MVIDDPLDFEGDNDPLLSTPRPAKRYSTTPAPPCLFPSPFESNPFRTRSRFRRQVSAGTCGGDWRGANGLD
jgi:hypothetical protein